MGPLVAAVPAIISGASSAIGGIAGALDASGAREKQKQLIESILSDYGNLSVPQLQELSAQLLGPSAQEGVRGEMDPRLQGEQMDVLNSLKNLEAQGGENPETRAVLSRILGDTGRQEQAGRNSILQRMRASGTSGSGAELAMQLQNNQQAANSAQSAGLDQAATANRRLLDTITARGNMASQMHGQDYKELSDAARAKDMISQYNAGQRTDTNRYNSQLPAQQYGMEMQKLAGKSNAATGAANAYGASANATAATGYGVGTGVGNAAGSAYQAYLDDQAKKDAAAAAAKAAGGTP